MIIIFRSVSTTAGNCRRPRKNSKNLRLSVLAVFGPQSAIQEIEAGNWVAKGQYLRRAQDILEEFNAVLGREGGAAKSPRTSAGCIST